MSMNPVEQLLEQHGERWRTAFVPPPLEGMLAVATAPAHHRARWVWSVVAAAALLVIPLATVVAVHDIHRSPAPAASRPTAPPTGLLGGVEWSLPILQRDGKAVTVAVNINHVSCVAHGTPILRGVAAETATTVAITVRAYALGPPPSVPPGSLLGCNMPLHAPVPLTVTLKQPLGDRTLIDATTGTPQPLTLAASTVPAPSYLPAGYVDQGVRWQDDFLPHPSQALHDYAGPDGELHLVRGRRSIPFSPYDPLLITAEVLGHPARLVKGSSSGTCLTWRDSEYWWAVCSVGSAGGAGPLGDGELHRIGNSIR
jgi:hypothetical protein